MDAHVKDVVREMSKASDEERVTFPEVVKALVEVGVERYHADLVAGRKTYYLPDGDFEETQVHKAGGAALKFSAEGVEKAVRAIQRQEIAYREFCRLIADAGCVGYFASLAGRRAVYYGRTGDEHVEWFPGAKPGRPGSPCSSCSTTSARRRQFDVITALYEQTLPRLRRLGRGLDPANPRDPADRAAIGLAQRPKAPTSWRRKGVAESLSWRRGVDGRHKPGQDEKRSARDWPSNNPLRKRRCGIIASLNQKHRRIAASWGGRSAPRCAA